MSARMIRTVTVPAGVSPAAAAYAMKSMRNVSKIQNARDDARAEAMRRHPAGKGRTI